MDYVCDFEERCFVNLKKHFKNFVSMEVKIYNMQNSTLIGQICHVLGRIIYLLTLA